MREIKQDLFETNNEISVTGGESAIDTQEEVDLISGGIGFDDDISEGTDWSERQRHLRSYRK